MSILRFGLSTLIITALTACGTLRTAYQTPAANIPTQFAHADAVDAANVIDAPHAADVWWQRFGDPQLDRVIALALERNNDLAAAAIKVRRAQLLAGISAGQQLPQLSANANTGYSRNLRGIASTTPNSSVQVALNYDLDLWGRLSRQGEVAQWEAQASEQDRASAALALIGTSAGLYWQAAYLHQRLALSAQSIAYAEQTLALVQTQYRAGAVSALETLEAQQNVASQRASQTQLQQQQVANDNALAILFDGPPNAAEAAYAAPQRLPEQPLPTLRADLPAAVLARRPDLRAVEQRLRGALANVDATRASLYPGFTLTGAVGSSSGNLREVLQNPIASLGLGITLPFLQWRQLQRNIQVSQADYEIAVLNFRQTLYSALGEVDNALSARAQYAQQALLLQQNLEAARQAENLYAIRYRAGAVALSVFLTAQEKRRSAEIAAADNRLNALNNQMTLFRALGGSDNAAIHQTN